MDYNKIYKKTVDVWGNQRNQLLGMVWKKVRPGAEFLDLGCGQGRDSAFMAKQGFKVTAVDQSQEGVKKLKDKSVESGLKTIKAICGNVSSYLIEKNKFAIINAFNILQFLPKTDGYNLIENIKNGLQSGGYVIIAAFTTKDPSYQNNANKTYFEAEELKSLFSDYDLIFYRELVVADPGHAGYEDSHQHGVVRMIAQKNR